MGYGCLYSTFTGGCTMWDEDNDVLNPAGADDVGNCMAEDDEDPTWCDDFACSVCRNDVCTCDDEEEEDY